MQPLEADGRADSLSSRSVAVTMKQILLADDVSPGKAGLVEGVACTCRSYD